MLLLSGCANFVQAPKALPVPAALATNNYHPRVAIDAQGIRHYAWSHCIPDGACSVGYMSMQHEQVVRQETFQPPQMNNPLADLFGHPEYST